MPETNGQDKTFRLTRKVNFKGEKGYDYSIRADTIEELKELEKQMIEYLEG